MKNVSYVHSIDYIIGKLNRKELLLLNISIMLNFDLSDIKTEKSYNTNYTDQDKTEIMQLCIFFNMHKLSNIVEY